MGQGDEGVGEGTVAVEEVVLGGQCQRDAELLEELGATLLAGVFLLDVGDEEAGEDADAGPQDGDLGVQWGEGADQGHGERAGQRGAQEPEAEDDGTCTGFVVWAGHAGDCTTGGGPKASDGMARIVWSPASGPGGRDKRWVLR